MKKILLGALILTVLGSATYFFGFSKTFKITNVAIDYEEFQNENTQLLAYFQPLVNKNILFVDVSDVIAKAKRDHPELAKLTTTRNFFHEIHIKFTEYPITANVEYLINKESFKKVIINQVGMTVYEDTENSNLPYIHLSITTKDPVTPETFSTLPLPELSKDVIAYIMDSTAAFQTKFGMKITDITYLPQARELRLKTEKNFVIWLDTQIDYQHQFLKLKKAMGTLNIFTTPLEYIDLRISGTSGEKVIFKQKK